MSKILGRVLKLAETLDFVGAKPPQNQVLKQTLVTGAAEFIGFHVSQMLLKLGKTVIGLDNLNQQ